MSKNKVTVSFFISKELAQKVEDVYQESECGTKSEFLGKLLESFLDTGEEEDSLVADLESKIRKLEKQILEKENVIKDLQEKPEEKPALKIKEENEGQEEDFSIILPTTKEQREILQKCYKGVEDLPGQILVDLVKMAMQWIQVRKGGLFTTDQYTRLFVLHDVAKEEFEVAFKKELNEIEE